MSNIAVSFTGVGKQYRLGRVGTGTLSHDLNRWWQTTIMRREDPYLRIGEENVREVRGQSPYVWALRDVSFQVERGDVVGIIGRNGAGKSTLLKVLSGITAPTTGQIVYQGRIASLLEVGTGFHPEMTGRENIYMNGSIMGMTRREIHSKLDAIVDFAGIERYLDTPVKRFSSGMTVRLGFAVAAFLEPDILVVDEVLTVGDAEFQRKALGKIHDVAHGQGRTVLFVSHNMAAVQGICNRGVVLHNGRLDFQGSIDQAVRHYQGQHVVESDRSQIIDHLTFLKSYIHLDSVSINGTTSYHSIVCAGQRQIAICLEGTTDTSFSCNINFKLRTLSGQALATYAPGAYRGELQHFSQGPFRLSCTVTLPSYLSQGDVIADLWVHLPQFDDFIQLDACCHLHLEGNVDPMCIPLHIADDGLCGL